MTFKENFGYALTQTETNFSTCTKCQDTIATECASEAFESTACLQESFYSLEATENAYGGTDTYNVCSNTSDCAEDFGECIKCESEVCTTCKYGNYLDESNYCETCDDNCLVCDSETSCSICDYQFYFSSSEESCEQCYFETDYFFECIRCSSTTDSYLNTCTACYDKYLHSYQKKFYYNSLHEVVDQGSFVYECIGRCPTGYSPSVAAQDSSPNLIGTSSCVYKESDSCYQIFRTDATTSLNLCENCKIGTSGKGMYLQLSDMSCVEKSDATTPSFEVYVSPDNQSDRSQDGSKDLPFEFLFNAFVRAEELGAPYTESTVTIYLQKGPHYLLRKEYELYEPSFTDATSLSTNVIIMPLPCDGSNADICVTDGEKVTIYNKVGAGFEFPVWRSLEIKNIIIDWVDSVISLQDSTNSGCLSSKEVCCQLNTDETGYESLSGNFLCDFYFTQPRDECYFATGGSIFRFLFHSQTVLKEPQSLLIEGCEFKHVNFDMNSLIETHIAGAKIKITGSEFAYFNTCGSVFRNFRLNQNEFSVDSSEQEVLQGYKYKLNEYPFEVYYWRDQEITTDFFQDTCLHTDDTKLCFDLEITNSVFKNFNQMKSVLYQALLVDRDWGLKVQGSILNLYKFQGKISFESNTVTNIHVTYDNCNMLDHNFSKLTSSDTETIQQKVVIAIEEYDHDILIAFNKFQKNSGTKGILYLDDQEGNGHSLAIFENEFVQNTGMYQSNVIWIRMKVDTSFEESLGYVIGYFMKYSDSSVLQCGHTSITGNNFSYNIGCPLQSGSLVYIECHFYPYDVIKYNDDYEDYYDDFWDEPVYSAITAYDFQQLVYFYFKMESENFIKDSGFKTVYSRSNTEKSLAVPVNYVLFQKNNYKYNFLSNDKGAVHTEGVLIVNIKEDKFENNGVSFFESFQQLKASENLKTRSSSDSELLEFDTIVLKYSGKTPKIVTKYVDPNALVYFKQGNCLSLQNVEFNQNWRFQDRSDNLEQNSQLIKTESMFGSVFLDQITINLTTIPSGKFLPIDIVLSDGQNEKDAQVSICAAFVEDTATCTYLEKRQITHLFEFGEGSNLYKLELKNIEFIDIEFVEPTYVSAKPPFLQLLYDEDNLMYVVFFLTLSNLSFINVDYYGDSANFIEIAGSDVNIKDLYLQKVNSKSYFDTDSIKENGYPKAFLKGNIFDPFEQDVGSGNYWPHAPKFIIQGGQVEQTYGQQGTFAEFHDIQIDGTYCPVSYTQDPVEDKIREDACAANHLNILRMKVHSSFGPVGGLFYFNAAGKKILVDNCDIYNITTPAAGKGGFAYIYEAETFTLKNSRIYGIQKEKLSYQGAIVHSTVSTAVGIIIQSNTINCYLEESYQKIKSQLQQYVIKDSYTYDKFGLKTYAAIFVSNAASLKLIDNEISNCYLGIQGGAVSAVNTIFVASGGSFRNNAGIAGGAMYLSNCPQASISKVTFTDNYATQGGAIYADTGTYLNITGESVFRGNGALDEGGAIKMANQASLKTEDVIFEYNWSVYQSSSVFLIGCKNSTFTRTIFRHNLADEATVVTMFTDLQIFSSLFYNNTALKGTKGIYGGFSETQIVNTFFGNTQDSRSEVKAELKSTQLTGGFIYYLASSTLTLENVQFWNGIAYQGGAIFLQGGYLNATGCEFKENNSVGYGGAIYLTTYEGVQISQCSFQSNSANGETGDDIFATGTNNTFEIRKTKFVSPKAKLSLEFQSVSLIAEEISFDQIWNKNSEEGAAISCINCAQIELRNSQFSNLQAEQGAALYIMETEANKGFKFSSEAKYLIEGNTFRNCSSAKGGAILLDNTENVLFRSNYFSLNQAVDSQKVSNAGQGGSIYFTCNKEFQNCKVTIESTSFYHNKAYSEGGAIKWTVIMPEVEMTDKWFKENYAGKYGHNIASYAQNLAKISEEEYKQALNQTENGNKKRVLQTSEGETTSEVAGQKSGGEIPKSYIALVDAYGQIVGTDAGSKLNVVVEDANQDNSDSFQPILGGTTQFLSSNGIFIMEGLEFIAKPGSNYSLAFSTDGIDLELPQNKAYLKYLSTQNKTSVTFDMSVALRECIEGEAYTDAGKCDQCDPNTEYSLALMSEPGNCKECPKKKATCLGGSKIGPKRNYWRESNLTDAFIECLNSRACLGFEAPTWNPKGQCETGFQGIICTECSIGWSRTGNFDCSRCPEHATNSVRIIAIFIVVIGVVVFMIRSTLAGASQLKNVQSVYQKILVNHLQLIMLTASFNLNWPKPVKEFFESTKPAAESTTQIFSFDCFMDNRVEGEDNSNSLLRIHFLKLGVISILPFLAVFAAAAIWKIVLTLSKKMHNFSSRFTSTVIILLFLIHPTIVQVLFDAFDCQDIDGTDRVLNDLEVVCWQGGHILWGYTCAVPAIIIWGLGIPAFAFLVLQANKQWLHKLETRQKFGFLFNGYKLDYYYWEIVIMYRKIAIIFISIFMRRFGQTTQALILFILLMVFISLTNQWKPFSNSSLNYIETLSLMTSILTIYCGLYFLADVSASNQEENDSSVRLSESSKLFFFVCIILSNFIFFSYWSVMMWKESMSQFRSKFKKVYLYLCLCGNVARLKKELKEQAANDYNDILYERFIKAVSKFERYYNEGELLLDYNVIQRIEHYCDQDVFYAFIGITERRRIEKLPETRKQEEKQKRAKQFKKNVMMSLGLQVGDNEPELKESLGQEGLQEKEEEEVSIDRLKGHQTDEDRISQDFVNQQIVISDHGFDEDFQQQLSKNSQIFKPIQLKSEFSIKKNQEKGEILAQDNKIEAKVAETKAESLEEMKEEEGGDEEVKVEEVEGVDGVREEVRQGSFGRSGTMLFNAYMDEQQRKPPRQVRMRTFYEKSKEVEKPEELIFIPGQMQHVQRPKKAPLPEKDVSIQFLPGEESQNESDLNLKPDQEASMINNMQMRIRSILKRKVRPEEQKQPE